MNMWSTGCELGALSFPWPPLFCLLHCWSCLCHPARKNLYPETSHAICSASYWWLHSLICACLFRPIPELPRTLSVFQVLWVWDSGGLGRAQPSRWYGQERNSWEHRIQHVTRTFWIEHTMNMVGQGDWLLDVETHSAHHAASPVGIWLDCKLLKGRSSFLLCLPHSPSSKSWVCVLC